MREWTKCLGAMVEEYNAYPQERILKYCRRGKGIEWNDNPDADPDT